MFFEIFRYINECKKFDYILDGTLDEKVNTFLSVEKEIEVNTFLEVNLFF